MEEAELKFDITDLKNLAKQLQIKREVQVGIFKENDSRKYKKWEDSSNSNVEIGFEHEFGNPLKKLPMRSFLRGPILERGQQLADAVNSSLEEDLSLPNAYKALAKEAEHIVEGAFASNGYGKWQALSDWTVAKRGESEPILDDTGQLKDSVKSKVVKL